MIRAALLVLGAALLAAAAPARFAEIAAVPSVNIVAPHVVVWLPPGYDHSRARYPVVYMHDGQNLFFPARSNFNKVWAADKAAERVIAAKRVAPFIIVGVDQPGEARFRQYFPQSLYALATTDRRAAIEKAAGGPLTGDAYLRFLTDELKPMIDRDYRTRADASHTAIAGSSMGGLMSCYALVERPDVFGRAACVSIHWPLTDPRPVPPNGAAADVIATWHRYFDAKLGPPRGRRLWLDHGTETLDAYYAPYATAMAADLSARRWVAERDFVDRTYPGAAHEENAWAARLDDILAWLWR